MRDYRFDFSNGTTDLVETFSVRTGYVRFYELLSGGGVDPRIRVESMGGGWAVVLRPGQGFRLPAEEAAGVVVTNISGTAMAGTLKLGPRDWQFEDQRLTGTVAVVDSNFALTTSGQAFCPYWGYSPAAGNLAHVQILNPPASGRIIELQTMDLIVGASTSVGLVLTTSLTLTNNIAGVYQSKLLSNSSSASGQVRTQDNPTALQSTRQIAGYTFGSQGQVQKQFRAPLVLNPGDGVMAFSTSPAVALSVGAEVVERPQV